MIDDEVKAVAVVVIVALAAISVYPILEEGRVVEPFSELGILGPEGKLGDYPREVDVGEEFSLFVYVGNHEGVSGYYRVLAKVGGQEANVSDVSPYVAPVSGMWETLLVDGGNKTIPVRMSFGEAGLNRRLVFELWRYDVDEGEFVYHQRWVQLWLNVTRVG